MLAAVPSCAGQCRFVRGFFVGAAGRGHGVVGILWGRPQPEVSGPAALRRGSAMSYETTEGTAAKPALRTLADKVNWLIDRARPVLAADPTPMPRWPP
jgi:hypothetical protein